MRKYKDFRLTKKQVVLLHDIVFQTGRAVITDKATGEQWIAKFKDGELVAMYAGVEKVIRIIIVQEREFRVELWEG